MTKKNNEDSTDSFDFIESCKEIKGYFTRKGFIKFVGENIPKSKSEFNKLYKNYLKMNVEVK